MVTISDEDKLIRLPILEYYDENIKKWVLNKMSSIELSSDEIVFDKKDNFPVQGNLNTLYIDINEKNFYLWNDIKSQYDLINTSTGDSSGNDDNVESISKEDIESLFT